jgi:NADH dehydrogenase [ubiquinone] 1 alpha subcomplex assembly factor 3
MPPLRPITLHLSKRPSIHEIAASILTPTPTCRARHLHHLPKLRNHSSCPRKPHHHIPSPFQTRRVHATSIRALSSPPPKTHERGPASTETTQTDFSNLDVLGGTPVPSTAIDACLWDGFHLNNGVKITAGAGVLLVGGEAFGWRPWDAGTGKQGEKRLLNSKGQWEVDDAAWGVLEVVWPKPGSCFFAFG